MQNLWDALLELSPNAPRAAADLARFYQEQHLYSEASQSFRRAVELDPDNFDLQLGLANSLWVIGLSEQALAAYDAALGLQTDSARAQMGRAHVQRALGQTEAAIACYRRFVDHQQHSSSAWWHLSSIRSFQFSDRDLAQMRRARSAAGMESTDGVFLDFALGKALDDRHDYDQAWRHYVDGNRLRRAQLQYDGERVTRLVDGLMQTFDQDLVSRAAELSAAPVTPIFVLGMPRSGSTLVEQILASHGQVEATGELPYMLGLGSKLALPVDGSDPLIRTQTVDELQAMASRYLDAANTHRQFGRSFFIDKMPDNFLYVGLIAMLLPNAKIIDMRREALDTCVANFRQFYMRGKEFSYNLQELGDYYLHYRRLMQHWNDCFPGRIHTVRYEQLVADSEGQRRDLLAYCGLEFEAACLDFHQTQRAITTASSEQVRQPIYESSVGYWKNYEAHLGELIEKLEAVML